MGRSQVLQPDSTDHSVVNQVIMARYRRAAMWYDLVYGPILQPGRRAAIQALDVGTGDRVLEVGVGTGLSMSLYPPGVELTGIDLSEAMLGKARTRAAAQRPGRVTAFLKMDGQRMAFRDNSFDAVLAMYIVGVAADATALLDEVCRVCKPNGTIVVVNHFQSRNPVTAAYNRLLTPLSRLISQRPHMPLREFLRGTHLVLESRTRANIFHYSTVLKCRNAKGA